MTPDLRTIAVQLVTVDELITEAEAHLAKLRDRKVELQNTARALGRKAA